MNVVKVAGTQKERWKSAEEKTKEKYKHKE